jgi:hypothetical protein
MFRGAALRRDRNSIRGAPGGPALLLEILDGM